MAQALAKYLLGQNDLNEAQKQAAEAGLADALNGLGILAQTPPPALNPWLLGALAVGGVVGLVALVVNANKNKTTPQPKNSGN